jgi:shikimate dehydrogenase
VTALSRRESPPALPGAETRAWRELPELAAQADILFNATPLGMAGQDEFPDLSFLAGMRRDAAVFDAVYNPIETRLLSVARARGLRTIGGLHLLVRQAAAAWERFTGTAAVGIGNVLEVVTK